MIQSQRNFNVVIVAKACGTAVESVTLIFAGKSIAVFLRSEKWLESAQKGLQSKAKANGKSTGTKLNLVYVNCFTKIVKF